MFGKRKPPFAVIVVGAIYCAIGVGGFIAHFHGLREGGLTRFDGAGIEALELIGLTAGIFLLLGRGWARWLALAWMLFHVGVGALNGFAQFAIHAAIGAAIAWILYRPDANQYFRPKRSV